MEPTWLAHDELETWTTFLAASQLIEEHIDAVLRRDWGLTHSEYEILAVLSQQPEHKMRMGHLARTVITAKSALTYRIASLERAGLVVRVRPDDDGRGLEALLTPQGEKLLNAAAPHHVQSVRQYFIDPLEPSELTDLQAIMTKLLTSLRGSSTNLRCAASDYNTARQDLDCRDETRNLRECAAQVEEAADDQCPHATAGSTCTHHNEERDNQQ